MDFQSDLYNSASTCEVSFAIYATQEFISWLQNQRPPMQRIPGNSHMRNFGDSGPMCCWIQSFQSPVFPEICPVGPPGPKRSTTTPVSREIPKALILAIHSSKPLAAQPEGPSAPARPNLNQLFRRPCILSSAIRSASDSVHQVLSKPSWSLTHNPKRSSKPCS